MGRRTTLPPWGEEASHGFVPLNVWVHAKDLDAFVTLIRGRNERLLSGSEKPGVDPIARCQYCRRRISGHTAPRGA